MIKSENIPQKSTSLVLFGPSPYYNVDRGYYIFATI